MPVAPTDFALAASRSADIEVRVPSANDTPAFWCNGTSAGWREDALKTSNFDVFETARTDANGDANASALVPL